MVIYDANGDGAEYEFKAYKISGEFGYEFREVLLAKESEHTLFSPGVIFREMRNGRPEVKKNRAAILKAAERPLRAVA